ncbi:MAG: glycosyltransferase family 4 protein, partial [Candidatus Gracilibacteria bacterium]|nr:glycosyltransferase family 4 protein [Candidatus Gracilibacteria bacterium]
MSAGIPVFGLRKGGLLETVVEGVTGEFFDFDDINEFKTKFMDFHNKVEEGLFDREKIRLHAEKFRKEVFFDKLGKFIESKFY